jgi:hypothetical protein
MPPASEKVYNIGGWYKGVRVSFINLSGNVRGA